MSAQDQSYGVSGHLLPAIKPFALITVPQNKGSKLRGRVTRYHSSAGDQRKQRIQVVLVKRHSQLFSLLERPYQNTLVA